MRHDALARGTTLKPNDSRAFIHRRIGGAVKGFATGGFTGALSGFTTAGRSTRPTTVSTLRGGGTQTTSSRRLQLGPFGPRFESQVSRFQIPAGTGRAAGELAGELLDRRARGPVAPTADGCPKGFHLNKSSYTLKDGTRVEERTLCVRNRRRNNDNGQAALRAARRLIGRKKSQEKIDEALKAIAPPTRRRSSPKRAPGGSPIVVAAG